MPIDYRRDDLTRLIIVTASEPVTGEELIALTERQAAEGAWSYGLLYDATSGHEPPSRDTIHRLVHLAGVLTTKYGRRGAVAMVLPDPALRRMGKRYATLGELAAVNACVFTTVREAEDWLSQDGGPLTLLPSSR